MAFYHSLYRMVVVRSEAANRALHKVFIVGELWLRLTCLDCYNIKEYVNKQFLPIDMRFQLLNTKLQMTAFS